MKKDFKKFQKEEMLHHDKIAGFYAKRNEQDYIWEVPADKYLLKRPFIENGGIVIDMGCGPSIFINRMIKRNKFRNLHYIGVDISSEMLKIAKQQVPKGKFFQDDMENFRYKGEIADTIWSLGALHHSASKVKTLKNWSKLLKANGYILLREPTKEALKRGHGESPNEEGVDIEQITNFALLNNFKIEKIIYFWSPLFHFINKVLIKLRLGEWRSIKEFWYIFLYLDEICISVIRPFWNKFNGDTVIVILKKNENSF